MGTCENEDPSLETQNQNNLEISSNGSHHHDVIIEGDDDDDTNDNHNDDDHHHKDQNFNQDQQHPDEKSAIVEHLESLELQENEKDEQGVVKSQNYPLRSNAIDCTFYLKTGTCKFGPNCRYNHPSKRAFQLVGDKEKGIEESNGFVVADTGKIDCKYFSTPGGCKYGDACRYNHSREKTEMKSPEFNFLGLPIRPLEKECTFYMRNGTCAYGANCRFHHPDPTAAKESSPGKPLANGNLLRAENSFLKPYRPLQSSGVSQGTLPVLPNGINSTNPYPYAVGTYSYHQGIPQNPGWNQNQATVSSSAIKLPLPHQMVNSFPSKADPSTHYEHVMQVEEFPERPGLPDCDYFMKTGDCKYRSACRFNHPSTRAPKLRLPPLSAKGSHPRSAKVLPVETTELSNLNPSNTRKNGIPSGHQQMQNGEFPERHGQPDCEYFLKTGNCKFRSACRYHHPKNRVSTSACALSEKGLPLRPGSRICRNYEQQGTCKYGCNCLFHHPDNTNDSQEVSAAVQHHNANDIVEIPAVQHHNANDIVEVPADSEPPAASNAVSDWDDGWVL